MDNVVFGSTQDLEKNQGLTKAKQSQRQKEFHDVDKENGILLSRI